MKSTVFSCVFRGDNSLYQGQSFRIKLFPLLFCYIVLNSAKSDKAKIFASLKKNETINQKDFSCAHMVKYFFS